MSYELEVIYKYMDKCDNEFSIAIEYAADELDMSIEELTEIYDRG